MTVPKGFKMRLSFKLARRWKSSISSALAPRSGKDSASRPMSSASSRAASDGPPSTSILKPFTSSKRTLVSWNSIIVGCSVKVYAMEGFKPDSVSFTEARTACSHAGLVNKGLQNVNIIKRIYKIYPRIEHYGCMVDLYSRVGMLEEAMRVIENMSIRPKKIVLGSLMAACRTRDDIILAERLMKYLDPVIVSNYVLLANMYAAMGKWEGSGQIRRMMKGLGIQKKPGISSVEIGCINHEFVAGDRSHVDSQRIYQTLELCVF